MQRSSCASRYFGYLMGGVLLLLSGTIVAGNITAGSKAEKLNECVAETTDMRKNHMDYLKHSRDLVVRKGVTGNKYSLAGCVDCHAGIDASTNKHLPVNHAGQFCDTCHQKTATSLACFQCHRKIPEDR